MSDEIKEEKELTHGFEINAREHKHALEHIEKHMSPEQVEGMVRLAKDGHSAHFKAGNEGDYKLEYHDGKLSIHSAH
jgi:hypothetical protein